MDEQRIFERAARALGWDELGFDSSALQDFAELDAAIIANGMTWELLRSPDCYIAVVRASQCFNGASHDNDYTLALALALGKFAEDDNEK